MKRIFYLVLMMLAYSIGNGQSTDGLKGYYPFDDCTADDFSGNNAHGAIFGAPVCECGAIANSLKLNGTTDYLQFLGLEQDIFATRNFTMSFYFRPSSTSGIRSLFSKRFDCSNSNAFEVRYLSDIKQISVLIAENDVKLVDLRASIDFDKCWQHVVILRQGDNVFLYINGVRKDLGTTSTRVNIVNNAVLSCGNTPCLSAIVQRFEGNLDELRIYNRALSREEIRGLFIPTDQIATPDTLIFQGGNVPIRISSTCESQFQWTPPIGVSDVNISNPVISPPSSLTYQLQFGPFNGICTSTDTIFINVVDPSVLECTNIFLPNAFTPNGDGKNDTYGISNPYVLEEFISFEIFDRWGNLVFNAEDPEAQWDGTYDGKEINPAVFLYKLVHKCNGEELAKMGSLTVLK